MGASGRGPRKLLHKRYVSGQDEFDGRAPITPNEHQNPGIPFGFSLTCYPKGRGSGACYRPTPLSLRATSGADAAGSAAARGPAYAVRSIRSRCHGEYGSESCSPPVLGEPSRLAQCGRATFGRTSVPPRGRWFRTGTGLSSSPKADRCPFARPYLTLPTKLEVALQVPH